MFWDHVAIPLSYKYDISYMIDDIIMQGHQRYIRHKRHYKTISMCLISIICVAASSVAVTAGVWTVNHLVSNEKGWAVKGDGGYEIQSDDKRSKPQKEENSQYQPETSDNDNAYSDVKEAEKSTGFEIPDIFKDSSLKCEKVRILYSDEDSYQAYIVYAKGSKKVDVSISSGKGITGDTILPYDITKKKWISTRNGDKVLMEAGSGKNEINCAVYKNDYIVSLNFENFSCAEAETVIQEADLSELKVQGD